MECLSALTVSSHHLQHLAARPVTAHWGSFSVESSCIGNEYSSIKQEVEALAIIFTYTHALNNRPFFFFIYFLFKRMYKLLFFSNVSPIPIVFYCHPSFLSPPFLCLFLNLFLHSFCPLFSPCFFLVILVFFSLFFFFCSPQ